MRSITFFSLLMLCSSRSWLAADPPDQIWRPDFATIDHFALLNESVRYSSVAAIERDWSPQYREIYVVDIHRTRNRFFLGFDEAKGVQDIAIRGTTNLRNAIYDLRFLKSFSPALGIHLFHGFEMMTNVLFRNLEPYLRKDRPLRISGQSLGAAEAVILAMILSRKGYHIEQVITFGQPKVTDEAGARAFAGLPLLRVVDLSDVVPLLPPARLVYRDNPYVHFGREVVLLEGAHYCIADEAFADRPIPETVVDNFSGVELDALLHEHNIKTYVASIAPKLGGGIRVPCSQRGSYLPALGAPKR